MVFGKKSIEEVGSKVEELDKKIQELNSKIDDKNKLTNEKIDLIADKLSTIEENNAKTLGNMDEELTKFIALNTKLEKQLASFKLLEEKASKKIFEKVSFEVKQQIESLLTTTKRYNELEAGMIKTSNNIEDLNKNVKELKEISKNINKADFNLNKYKLNMDKADKNKLELMKENERLKQLIAKERRKR